MTDSFFFEEDRNIHMAIIGAIKSWKVDVLVDGEWTANGMRFATVQEASRYAADISSRWTAVRDIAVRPTTDAVNETWPGGVR